MTVPAQQKTPIKLVLTWGSHNWRIMLLSLSNMTPREGKPYVPTVIKRQTCQQHVCQVCSAQECMVLNG